jgi:hypothetical protein
LQNVSFNNDNNDLYVNKSLYNNTLIGKGNETPSNFNQEILILDDIGNIESSKSFLNDVLSVNKK